VATDSENQRLQDRVDDLERQLRRRRTSNRRGAFDYSDDYTDVLEDKLDEMASFFRGLFRGGLDGFRTISDSASRFSEEVLDDNVAEPGDSPRDTLRRLPDDFASGLSRALDRSLDAPRRAADQLNHTYRDEPRRRRTHRRSSSDDSYDDWATSDLRREARYLGISGYDDMSRSELLAELEPPAAGTPPPSPGRATAASPTK